MSETNRTLCEGRTEHYSGISRKRVGILRSYSACRPPLITGLRVEAPATKKKRHLANRLRQSPLGCASDDYCRRHRNVRTQRNTPLGSEDYAAAF